MRSPLFLLYILCTWNVFSQVVDTTLISLQKEVTIATNDSIKIAALIELSAYQMDHDIHSAEQSINQALTLIDTSKIRNYKQLGATYIQLGVLNRRRALHSKAIGYYFKALEIFKTHQDSLLISDVYHNMGMAYRHEKDHRKAIKHYKMSIAIKEHIKDTHGLGAGYNMMGVSYRQLQEIDTAMLYYKKAKGLFASIPSPDDVRRANNNMAVVFRRHNQHKKALELYQENITHARRYNKMYSLSNGYYNLSKVYINIKEYSNALKAIDSAIIVSKAEGFKEYESRAYLRKSFIYRKMGNYKDAYDNYRIYNRKSDSIYNIENVKKIQSLELNFGFRQEQLADSLQFIKEKKEVALIAEAEASKKQLYFLLFILALTAAAIIWILIRRVYKGKAQIIAEQLEKEEIQGQLLSQKVKAKEEDIKRLVADNSMRLAFKEELLQQLKTKISKQEQPETLKKSLESLTLELQAQINTEGKSSILQEQIDGVNEGFDSRLRTLYPTLTKSEREVCALLRLNLSIKEIMIIRGTTIDAIKSVRYRIRKKLQLTAKDELEQFIQNL